MVQGPLHAAALRPTKFPGSLILCVFFFCAKPLLSYGQGTSQHDQAVKMTGVCNSLANLAGDRPNGDLPKYQQAKVYSP